MEFEGIVIRRTPYKGDDVMISVLTKETIKSFLAKGVLKVSSKNSYSTNLFAKSRFQIFKGKEGDFLRVGEVIESYPNLNNELERLSLLDFISELTNNFVENNDCSNIYNFLEKTLLCFNKGFSAWTASLIYFAKILKYTGYSFEVDSCVKCGSKNEINSISLKDGGFICKTCYNEALHKKISPRKLKIIRYIFKVDIENFEKIEFEKDECKELIFEFAQFLEWNSQITLKSLSILEKL